MDDVTYAIIRVLEEIIAIKRNNENRTRRIWVRKWIQRRRNLGISNSLLRELAVEDLKSYCNFLRINENMFNILLDKVSTNRMLNMQ